jgi:tetratricopeptide (TPR) repeat protein
VRDDGQVLPPEAATLAEAFTAAGYRTGGFVASPVLDGRYGFAQGFERYVEAPAAEPRLPRPGDAVVKDALSWIDGEPGRPFFVWVQLDEPRPTATYDAAVASVDTLVGRLLDGLLRRGLAGRTWVVAAGAFGEPLGEHGEDDHGFFLYESAIHVPLIVADPGGLRGRVDEPVSLLDVAPTLLQGVLGRLRSGGQGRSLIEDRTGRVPVAHRVVVAESWTPRLHFGAAELRSVRDGRHKLVDSPRPELFDLDADPAELKDLSAADPARVVQLRQALAAAGAPAVDQGRGDAKDHVASFGLLRAARRAASAGRDAEALEQLGRALGGDPSLVEAYTLTGDLHRRAGRLEDALSAYQQAAERDVDSPAAAYGTAAVLEESGRLEEAEAAFDRARELGTAPPWALWHLADLWIRMGRFAEAEGALQEGLDRKADRPRFLVKLAECYVEMKRYPEAKALAKEALAVRPNAAGAHVQMARVHQAEGDAAGAAAEYRAAVGDDPKDGRSWLALARLLAAAGDLPGAEAAARAALGGGPAGDPSLAAGAHGVLASVYARQGRGKEAARERAAASVRPGRRPGPPKAPGR